MPEENDAGNRKSELEVEKLQLDLDRERARAGIEILERQKIEAELEGLRLENERRIREKRQADYSDEKLRLEIQDLKRPAKTWGPLIQVLAVVVGVLVSVVTYCHSVHDTRNKDIHAAAERLQSGDPSAAVELGRYDEALGILVRTVDATHGTIQKSWPIVTRAALDEIYKRRTELDEEQKKLLRTAMSNSNDAIQTKLQEMTTALALTTAATGEQPKLEDLVCIQLALQNILNEKPPSWQKTEADVRGQLLGEPHC